MVPTKMSRYQIKSKLGQGGMATVYRAYDPNFGREVAVKVLPPQFLHDSTFRARFQREAQIIASLEHRGIVPVYDFGEDNGQPFIVMRLMKGGSLMDQLASGALSLAETARILTALAPALDEAHKRGIIHRDLKPGNILFDEYRAPYIADFGVAKLSQTMQSLSVSGSIIGTPLYMSPEQCRGEPVDGRSDIYALGVMLFQMLSGQCPYSAPTPISVMYQHINEPVPNIISIIGHLPPRCQQIIEGAMAKERDKRYPSASALAADVQQLAQDTIPDSDSTVLDPTELNSTVGLNPTRLNQPTRKNKQKKTSSGSSSRSSSQNLEEFFTFPTQKLPNLNPPTATKQISPKDGMVMLHVAAGEFLMGTFDSDTSGNDNEKPQRKVYLDAYWIDQTPVTNKMFAQFVAETGYQTEAERAGDVRSWRQPQGLNRDLHQLWDHPVVYVTYDDAQAYCKWAGRRLPTEAEWEKAARGSDGRTYPWGNEAPNNKLLNFNWQVQGTTAVNRYPAGASPFGAFDMAGNVWEWVADWYDEQYYKQAPVRNPTGPSGGKYRVLRGGSWNYFARFVRAASRGRDAPTVRLNIRGFRCARSF